MLSKKMLFDTSVIFLSKQTGNDASGYGPFKTFEKAEEVMDASSATAFKIVILDGAYAENVTFTKPVEIVGLDPVNSMLVGNVEFEDSAFCTNISISGETVLNSETGTFRFDYCNFVNGEVVATPLTITDAAEVTLNNCKVTIADDETVNDEAIVITKGIVTIINSDILAPVKTTDADLVSVGATAGSVKLFNSTVINGDGTGGGSLTFANTTAAVAENPNVLSSVTGAGALDLGLTHAVKVGLYLIAGALSNDDNVAILS